MTVKREVCPTCGHEIRVRVVKCRLCKIPFQAGIGTGRRYDAKFCSEQHKNEFHSGRRKTGQNP